MSRLTTVCEMREPTKVTWVDVPLHDVITQIHRRFRDQGRVTLYETTTNRRTGVVEFYCEHIIDTSGKKI